MKEYTQFTQKFILSMNAEQDHLDYDLNEFCRLGDWHVHSWQIYMDDRGGLRCPAPYKIYLLEREIPGEEK